MKKTIIAFTAAVMTVSCIKVTPEQTIDRIYSHFDVAEGYEPASAQYGSTEDLALAMADDAGIKDIWTLDTPSGTGIIGEIQGSRHPDKTILLTSSTADETGCSTIIEVLRCFRKLKIKPGYTFTVAFYRGGEETLSAVAASMRSKEESILFNLNVTEDENAARNTFTIGERDVFFNKILEIVPEYMNSHGDFSFVQCEDLNPELSLDASLYTYRVDRSSFASDAAAVATFLFLMD